MTLGILVAVVAILGWVVAFPLAKRGIADLARIPGAVWRITGYRSRKQWRLSMQLGYLAGGWPSIVAVLAWRRSETRLVLRDEWQIMIEERRARREIVLAHYEDEPGDVTPSP
jgi:hypothetical protein